MGMSGGDRCDSGELDMDGTFHDDDLTRLETTSDRDPHSVGFSDGDFALDETVVVAADEDCVYALVLNHGSDRYGNARFRAGGDQEYFRIGPRNEFSLVVDMIVSKKRFMISSC